MAKCRGCDQDLTRFALGASWQDHEHEANCLSSKLDTLAASEKYASERYADACRQLDSVTANLEEAESRLEDREKQLGECTAGYQTLEREVAELRSRLEDRELTLKASEKLRHETNERLARESVRRNDLESSLGELQAQYGHTYNGMLTARADRDELQRSLDNERKDVEAALVQIAEQAKQYNELYTERSNLLYRLDTADQRSTILEVENADLREKRDAAVQGRDDALRRLGRIHDLLTFPHPPRPAAEQFAVVESVILQVIELAKPAVVEIPCSFDEQIERDAKAGKLDFLADEAKAALKSGTVEDL